MKQHAERGYVGLLGLVITVGLIGLLFYVMYIKPSAKPGSATSTPTQVGQSSLDQDMNAIQGAKAIQDVSAKRAADTNAEMQ